MLSSFALEDLYGLTIETVEGTTVLRVDPRKGKDATELSEVLSAWADISAKYKAGEIDRDAYDNWCYNYPAFDTTSGYVKIPSQELSDQLTKAFKKKLKD